MTVRLQILVKKFFSTLLRLMVAGGVLFPLRRIEATEYQVRESGASLEVIGPKGNKIIVSDLNFSTNDTYQAEIPLDFLKPPEPDEDDAKGERKPDAEEGETKKTRSAETSTSASEDEDEEVTINKKRTIKTNVELDEEVESPANNKSQVEVDDTDRMIVEANHLFNRRKYFEASEVVEELLRKKPELVRAWIMKGSLMYVQGHKDLATKAWQRGLALEPNNADIKHYLERYR